MGEIYAFFRLLADGQVALGTAEAAPDGQQVWPVALVQREEHDGTRRYRVEADSVRIVSGCIDRSGACWCGSCFHEAATGCLHND